MKDWKDQLRAIKRTMQNGDTSEKYGEKPAKVDFEPPESWLAGASTDGRSAPNRCNPPAGADRASGPVGRASVTRSADPNAAKGSSRTTLPYSDAILRKTTPQRPAVPADRQSGRQPVAPTPAAPPPAFRPQIDASRSLSMPDWAEVGRALQHPEAHGGAPLSVRVGIDFGTAFSKVALRAGPDMVTVDWSSVTGDASPVGRWIVPGFVCRGSGGEFGWKRFVDGEWQGNLKLPLVQEAPSAPCPCAALAYLAEVIRYSRAFLYRHPEVGRKLANRTLRWELNIGCPTEPHENPLVVERFRHVARTAWWLAGRDDLDAAIIRTAWDRRDLDTGLETEPGVVPEFVAQIAGYLRSPQVNDGLHALVDVGAATLDVAMFNVVLPRDGNSAPRIPIFFSAVKPLGTHFRSHRRHANLGLELVWDDATPIEAAAEFARRHGKDPEAIDGIDAVFAREVAHCIAGVMDGTRTSTRGDPRSSAWREGLPIFVTGGGAACDVYRRALRESEAAVKVRLEQSTRFRFVEMDPARATSADVDPTAATRLTVAIGLTEDTEDIARIVPHRDIEPITRSARERVDHTELYGDR